MMQNWEEQLINEMVVPPSRGISTGWRNGLKGTWWSSVMWNAKSCTWGGTAPFTSTHWGKADCKAALQKSLWPWGSNVPLQHQPTASWAALGRGSPAGRGSWSFPSVQHWWGTSGSSAGIPSIRETWACYSEFSAGPWRWRDCSTCNSLNSSKSLQHLQRAGTVHPGEEKALGILPMWMNAWWEEWRRWNQALLIGA